MQKARQVHAVTQRKSEHRAEVHHRSVTSTARKWIALLSLQWRRSSNHLPTSRRHHSRAAGGLRRLHHPPETSLKIEVTIPPGWEAAADTSVKTTSCSWPNAYVRSLKAANTFRRTC